MGSVISCFMIMIGVFLLLFAKQIAYGIHEAGAKV
jgi:hypothetical protein